MDADHPRKGVIVASRNTNDESAPHAVERLPSLVAFSYACLAAPLSSSAETCNGTADWETLITAKT